MRLASSSLARATKHKESKMSVMGPDGKILQPGGGWWSPYGDTDEEIQKNMKTGH